MVKISYQFMCIYHFVEVHVTFVDVMLYLLQKQIS